MSEVQNTSEWSVPVPPQDNAEDTITMVNLHSTYTFTKTLTLLRAESETPAEKMPELKQGNRSGGTECVSHSLM